MWGTEWRQIGDLRPQLQGAVLPALVDVFPKERKVQKNCYLQCLIFLNVGKYTSMPGKIKYMNVVASPKFKYSHN